MAAPMEIQEMAGNHEEQPVAALRQVSSGDHSVVFDEMAGQGADELATELELSEVGGKKKRVPRRIIHFINGETMEEYSTDEEEEEEPQPDPVDPKSLDWLRWFWFWLVLTATKSLAVADFLGEKLAWFFGITTPKYQYVIDEYHKMKEEEEEDERLEREEEEAQLSSVTTNDNLQQENTTSDNLQNIDTPINDNSINPESIELAETGGAGDSVDMQQNESQSAEKDIAAVSDKEQPGAS